MDGVEEAREHGQERFVFRNIFSGLNLFFGVLPGGIATFLQSGRGIWNLVLLVKESRLCHWATKLLASGIATFYLFIFYRSGIATWLNNNTWGSRIVGYSLLAFFLWWIIEKRSRCCCNFILFIYFLSSKTCVAIMLYGWCWNLRELELSCIVSLI